MTRASGLCRFLLLFVSHNVISIYNFVVSLTVINTLNDRKGKCVKNHV